MSSMEGVGISALMLDTGHLILDKRNNFRRMIQHPVSLAQNWIDSLIAHNEHIAPGRASIQYLTVMKYNAKNSPKIHDPKIFF